MDGYCSEFSCELMAAVKAAGTRLHPDFLLETDRNGESKGSRREWACVCVFPRENETALVLFGDYHLSSPQNRTM